MPNLSSQEETKFTPAIRYGITHVALHLIRDGEKVTAKNRLVKLERCPANTLLLQQMFAAPALYEALAELAAYFPSPDLLPSNGVLPNERILKAHAALRRARGESCGIWRDPDYERDVARDEIMTPPRYFPEDNDE